MKNASYRKHNDRTQNTSTYHKKDGTPVRGILKREAAEEIKESETEMPLPALTVSDLRYYASALGIYPVDVEGYLGKRVSIYKLTKAELLDLHRKIKNNPIAYRLPPQEES